MKRFLLAVLLPCLLIACSSSSKPHSAGMAVLPYSPESVWNLKLGRDYAAAGRYELAREHYLLAIAATDDPEMYTTITQELSGVDRMIKTLR